MTRLYIPGPTDVHHDVLQAQAQPMIGHRTEAFVSLMQSIQPKLRQVFQTDHRVYVAAASGSGLQEACVRNCVAERLLVVVNGAFSERWFQVADQNGVPADRVEAPWGQAIDADQLARALPARPYDALAIVHNETSTGVENPLAELCARARALNPDLLIMVDAVSSLAGADVQTDAWEVDVVLTSSQKCLALPPGLALAAVSDRALARAEKVPHRGWYFDFLLMERYIQQHMTPATPAISLLYALDVQLTRILEEGLQTRFRRHAAMAEMAQAWALEHGGLFAEDGYRSKTVTTVKNSRKIDVHALISHLEELGITLANGYGPLKNETFRIGHMGETSPDDVAALLETIDAYLKQPGGAPDAAYPSPA
jgi:predicted phosphoserine aminotransferase